MKDRIDILNTRFRNQLGKGSQMGTPPGIIAYFFLAISVIMGVTSVFYYLFISEIAIHDFQTYYDAARMSLAGEPFVGVKAELPTGPYVYSPITVIIYYPLTLFSRWVAYSMLFAVNTTLAVFSGYLIIQYIENHGDKLAGLDKILIYLFVTCSILSIANLVQGQPNFIILISIILGYYALESRNEVLSGLIFAIPAIIKLWPALFGIWFVKKRSPVALLTAFITGISSIILGIIIFGLDTYITYFDYILNHRRWSDRFIQGADPNALFVSIRRPLSIIFPKIDPNTLTLLGVITLLPILLYFMSDIDSHLQSLCAFSTLLSFVLLIFPSIPSYFIILYFPVLSLIYLSEYEIHRIGFSLGIFLLTVPVTPDHVAPLLTAIFPSSANPEIILDLLTDFFGLAHLPLYGVIIILISCYFVNRSEIDE